MLPANPLCKQWNWKKKQMIKCSLWGEHQFKYMQHSIPKFYSATVLDYGTKLQILQSKYYVEYMSDTEITQTYIKSTSWPWTYVNYKYSLKRENSLSNQTPYYAAVSSLLEKRDPFWNPFHSGPPGNRRRYILWHASYLPESKMREGKYWENHTS